MPKGHLMNKDLTDFKNWLLINCSSSASAETHYWKMKSYFLHNSEFNQESVNTYLLENRTKWKTTTVNIHINSLKWYAKYLKVNIEFPKLKTINVSAKEYLTQEELIDICDKLPLIFKYHHKIEALLTLMFESGVRPKNVLNLKREDINFETKTILIKNTKTYIDKTLPLSDRACKLLLTYFNQEVEKNNAFNISKSILIYTFKKINVCLGLKKKISPYTMRRCFAHHMIREGVKLTALQLNMGHKNINTTLGYLKVNEQEASDEMRNILNKKQRKRKTV